MASIYRNGIKFTGSNYEVADDKLDATSPRPVQNKVVTEKLTSSINTYVVTTDKNGAFKIGNLNKYLASMIDDISITDNYGYAEFDTPYQDSYGNWYSVAKNVWDQSPIKNKVVTIAVKFKPIVTIEMDGVTDDAGWCALWNYNWALHVTDPNTLFARNTDYDSVYNVVVADPAITCDKIIINSNGVWRLHFTTNGTDNYVGSVSWKCDVTLHNYNQDRRHYGIFEFNNYYDIENAINQMNATDPLFTDATHQPATFIWFSDVHGDADNLSRIVQLRKEFSTFNNSGQIIDSKIKDTIFTGDGVKISVNDSIPPSYWDDCGAEDILFGLGNHDCNKDSTNQSFNKTTAAESYATWYNGKIANWGVTSAGANLCYYYKDYPTSSLRLIMLDCIHWDTAQANWLTSILSSAKTAGYGVICTSHYYATQLIDANHQYLETNFNQGHSMTNDNLSAAAVIVQSFIDNGGEFICWLCGHEHRDNTFLSATYPKQLILGVEMATHYTTQIGQPSVHIDKTKSQDCFNLISFNTKEKLIRVYRVGNDNDLYMRKKTSMCINYKTLDVLYNDVPMTNDLVIEETQTTDSSGWIRFHDNHGTTLNKNNCAGIIVTGISSPSYTCIDRIMTNNDGDWRGFVHSHNDLTTAISNTSVTYSFKYIPKGKYY